MMMKRKKRTKQLSRISERENDDGSRETVVIFSRFWCFIKPMYFLTFFYFVLDTTMESQKRKKTTIRISSFSIFVGTWIRVCERLRDLYRKASQSIKPTAATNNNSREKSSTGTLDTKRNKWIQSKSKTSVSFPSDLKVFQLMRLILWSCAPIVAFLWTSFFSFRHWCCCCCWSHSFGVIFRLFQS